MQSSKNRDVAKGTCSSHSYIRHDTMELYYCALYSILMKRCYRIARATYVQRCSVDDASHVAETAATHNPVSAEPLSTVQLNDNTTNKRITPLPTIHFYPVKRAMHYKLLRHVTSGISTGCCWQEKSWASHFWRALGWPTFHTLNCRGAVDT